MKRLFAKIAADLSALSVDEINAAIAGHLEVARKVQANDEGFLAEYGLDGVEHSESIVEQMREAAADVKALRTELASRGEDEGNYTADINESFAAMQPDEPTGEGDLSSDAGDGGDGDGDDGAGDGDDGDAGDGDDAAGDGDADDALASDANDAVAQPDEVLADGSKPDRQTRQRRVARPANASERHTPIEVREPSPNALRVAGGIQGFEAGSAIDRGGLAAAMLEAARVTEARPGARVRVPVASASFTFDESRMLKDGDDRGNLAKLMAILPEFRSVEELEADGGLCAPLTPIYDLPLLAVQDRPVRDALPTYNAERGGITFPTPLGLSSVSGAITYVTPAEDAAGGSSATKSCLDIDCEPFLEAEIAAIAACVTWHNMTSMAWPERVANVNELVAALHARVAETAILDAFGDPTLAEVVTDAQVYGAVASLFQGILKAAAGYRSRNRMRRDATLQVFLPQWVPDLFAADLAVSQFDRFVAQAQIISYLRANNVEPTFYMDTETDAGQIFAAQEGEDTLLDFPTEVVWYLFAPGTWLNLDMGRLDVGVVRDSTLNALNEWQTFWETFEGPAKIGIESLAVTSTVCVNGATGGPDTLRDCS